MCHSIPLLWSVLHCLSPPMLYIAIVRKVLITWRNRLKQAILSAVEWGMWWVGGGGGRQSRNLLCVIDYVP